MAGRPKTRKRREAAQAAAAREIEAAQESLDGARDGEPVEPPPAPVMKEPGGGPVFSHATRARCPRCGATYTRADGTLAGGQVKRWQCLHPSCRHRWKTAGKPI